MTPEEEARHILEFFDQKLPPAFELIRQQILTLYTRGGLLLTLSGISLTLFGISGKMFTGPLNPAYVTLLLGILLILVSAFWVFARVMRVKWSTQDLGHAPEVLLSVMIRERDHRRRGYHQAGWLFLCGGALYLLSLFAIYLHATTLATGAWRWEWGL